MVLILTLLLLGILGLLSGAAIGVASGRALHRRDADVRKVELVLPNVDCGACGFASCKDFAEAAVRREAEPTGCVPGGPKVAHDIGDILGVPVAMPDPQMAVVHCKGGLKEASDRCRYVGLADCQAALIASNGQKTCFDGCLGLGSCVAACPFDAIHIEDEGVASVAPNACTGCGLCVGACPRKIIALIPRVHKIFIACANHDRGARVGGYCSVGCTACALCVKASAPGAIDMEGNLPVLDYSSNENFVVAAHTCPSNCFVDLVKFRPKVNIDAKCTGCGDCVSACPVDAISGEKNRRHAVDKEKCIGCGLCLNTCPMHSIAMWGGLGYMEDNRRSVTRA